MSQLPRYESYKDSGVQWLGEIPNHWNVKQLKFAVTCNDEALGENTELDYEILYVDISSVSLTEGIKHKEELLFENAPSRARRVVKSGDVLVSTVRTYLKAITYVESAEENLIASTGFAVLRPSEKFDSKFIGYWIQSEGMVGNIVANSVGVSYPAINSTDLVRLPIVELPLSEQKFIADFLDKRLAQVDALIAKQETLLEKLAEQRVALISHAVTKGLNPDVEMKESGVEWLGGVPSHWAVKKLKFLTSYFKGFAFKSEDFSDIGVPLIKASNVKKFSIENVESHIAFDKVQDTFDRVKLQEGDLILSTVGSLPNVVNSAVGQIAYVSPNFSGSYLNQNNVCFRSNEKVLSVFLKYFVMSSFFRRNLDIKALWIANQAYLEVLDVQNISIIFPSLDEQKIIADFLDNETQKIDDMRDLVNKTKDRLVEYRSTLITKVVTGKIDVRNLKLN